MKKGVISAVIYLQQLLRASIVMKIPFKTLLPFLLIVLGIALAFASAALNLSFPFAQGLTPTPLAATATPTVVPVEGSQAGSTDGIVLMATLIVLIVFIPILLRRRDWMPN
jgi:hypothetical protein